MDTKDPLDLKAQEIIRETRAKISSLDENSKDMLFREARSFNGWNDKPVSQDQLHEIYDLMKVCPTSSNVCPIRIKFVCSDNAKKVLEPILFEPNRAKTMQAPAVAILGNDEAFYEHDSFLTPHRPGAISTRMIENPELIRIGPCGMGRFKPRILFWPCAPSVSMRDRWGLNAADEPTGRGQWLKQTSFVALAMVMRPPYSRNCLDLTLRRCVKSCKAAVFL